MSRVISEHFDTVEELDNYLYLNALQGAAILHIEAHPCGGGYTLRHTAT